MKDNRSGTATLESDPAIGQFLGNWVSEGEHVYAITGSTKKGATLRLILKEGVAAEIENAHIVDDCLRFNVYYYFGSDADAAFHGNPMQISLQAADCNTLIQESRLRLPNGKTDWRTSEICRQGTVPRTRIGDEPDRAPLAWNGFAS